MKKQIVLFFLIFLTPFVSAQDSPKILYGKITDLSEIIKNAHIINLKSKLGTFSNDNGNFRMRASVNDSLQISSIGYKTRIIVIQTQNFGLSENNFILTKKTYELDEVIIKDHDLTGSLTADIQKTPEDRKAEALSKTMDFSKIDWNAKVADDHIDTNVRPHIVNTVPNRFVGAGASFGMPFKYSERLWALRRDLAHKKSFPQKILSEFGENFFFKELKIPVEKYYHFLEYCNPLGIENLYKNDNILEVIKILQDESKTYLEIIKQPRTKAQGIK